MSKNINNFSLLQNAVTEMKQVLSKNTQAIILLTSTLAFGCIETPTALIDAPEQTQTVLDQGRNSDFLVPQEDQEVPDMQTTGEDMYLEADMDEVDQEVQDMYLEADMQTPAQDMFEDEDQDTPDMQTPEADMQVPEPLSCDVELVNASQLNTFVLGSTPTIYGFQINTNALRPAVEEVEVAFINADGEPENNIDRSVEVVSFRDQTGSSWIELSRNGLATFQDLESETLSYNVVLETQNTGRDQALPLNNITTEINAVLEDENGDEIICESASSANFNLSPMVLKYTELLAEMVELNWGLNNNINFEFTVNTILDENRNEFNGLLSGRLTNITFAIQSQGVDLSALEVNNNQGFQRNAINIAGQNLDLFSVELDESIVLESGDVSLAIGLDVSNMEQNSFLRLDIIDVTYATGFEDHQVTQGIITEPIVLISRD
jgi:hypothetical protein